MNESINKAEEKIKETFKEAEKKLEADVEKVEKAEKSILQNRWVQAGGVVALILVICGGFVYWQSSSTRVKIDSSLISAPLISLSPTTPGQLQETYVNEGDFVSANAPVAKVGDEIIKTKIAGIIVSVQKDAGQTYNPGQAVVSMIDPTELHAVGTIDENKGLDKIKVGQPVSFTVDAFGSKEYTGIVDAISPTAHAGDVVFNISDNRPTQQFDIKVRFNQSKYPELKNGMSAKLTVFTK
jgi:multidrug resistance efflux pump